MIPPYTPDYTTRPVMQSQDITLSNPTGQPGAVAVILAGSGMLVACQIKSATPGATITFFDSATAVDGPTLSASGHPIRISDGAATPLNPGIRYGYGHRFANGLSVLVGGTVSATVMYQAG